MAKPILDVLSDEHVVSFQLSADRLFLIAQEECDLCFNYTMDKAEVKRLIDELTDLHDQMIVRE